MRKPRLREVKSLAQGHTAGPRRNWHPNPGLHLGLAWTPSLPRLPPSRRRKRPGLASQTPRRAPRRQHRGQPSPPLASGTLAPAVLESRGHRAGRARWRRGRGAGLANRSGRSVPPPGLSPVGRRGRQNARRPGGELPSGTGTPGRGDSGQGPPTLTEPQFSPQFPPPTPNHHPSLTSALGASWFKATAPRLSPSLLSLCPLEPPLAFAPPELPSLQPLIRSQADPAPGFSHPMLRPRPSRGTGFSSFNLHWPHLPRPVPLTPSPPLIFPSPPPAPKVPQPTSAQHPPWSWPLTDAQGLPNPPSPDPWKSHPPPISPQLPQPLSVLLCLATPPPSPDLSLPL